jgi:hypothetical protein
MMEAARSSETSVYNKSTRRHVPEDGILQLNNARHYVALASSTLRHVTYTCEVLRWRLSKGESAVSSVEGGWGVVGGDIS